MTDRKLRIEIFPRRSLFRGTQWYFRIKAANHQVLAASEGYNKRADCLHTATLLRDQLHEAGIFGAYR